MARLIEENGALWAIDDDGAEFRLGITNGRTFFPLEDLRPEAQEAIVYDFDTPSMRAYENGVVWFTRAWYHPVEEMHMPAFAFYDPALKFYQFRHAYGVQYNDPVVYEILAGMMRGER